MANKIDLDGRFAVVTGGAQGIGRAISERFLASGAAVAIWDKDQNSEGKQADRAVTAAQQALTVRSEIRQAKAFLEPK